MLYSIEKRKTVYKPLPKFPAVTRDLALICKDETSSGEIEKKIKALAGPCLEKIEIFDVYKGAQVAEGYKSIAFALTFQADRTLTVEEVSVEYDKIFAVLAEKFGAAMRA